MRLFNLACGVALSAIVMSSHAIVNGFDPDTTQAVVPYTDTVTPNWKFVGTYLGVSGVQVAPQWILTSRHAAPPVGTSFTNKFGTATVGSACVFPTPTYITTGQNDLALCRLSTPITLPTGTSLPAVVGFNHTAPFNSQSIHHWGNLLASGYSTGARRSAWSTFSGLPPHFSAYDIALNPTGPNLTLSSLNLPQTDNGDSGGGVYFYSTTANPTTGFLVGVLVSKQLVGSSPAFLSPEFAQWIVQTISGQGDVAPVLADIGQLVSNTTAFQARNMASDSVTVGVTGPTTASITFTEPPASAAFPTPITSYLILNHGVGLSNPSVNLAYGPGTYPLTGLTDGRQYQACVRTGNSQGYGPGVDVFFVNNFLRRPGCAFFIAGSPNAPQVFFGNLPQTVTRNATTGKTDVTMRWNAPLPNGVTTSSYVVTVNVWPSWVVRTSTVPIRTNIIQTSATSHFLPNVTSGEEYACWTVAARSPTLTKGAASTERCFDQGSIVTP